MYSDAELHIAYGWDLFDRVTVGNKERQNWKAQMVELMKQPGIIHHGRLGKKDLRKLREICGILAYPSDFTEIFCMTVAEAMAAGCVPVTNDLAALKEINKGVLVKGDIYDPDTKQEYFTQLLDLMGNKERWNKLSKRCIEAAQIHAWENVADKWAEIFATPEDEPLVTIVTPTIRRGWWNIMSHNIATQTYKNIQWVIVDDYPEDRSKLASKYAEKYDLNIEYYRGKERKTKRHYGLVNANNTGLLHAKGELLIILQDFVLMPETGVEDLVTLYKKNPNSLLAPVDEYYTPKIKPDTESEDWFHGELDVKGEFMRSNIRIQNLGMRHVTHAFDYEQNYGAVPTRIAKELGGWYEFYDEGLGFDNTEFAWRAVQLGYDIIVDETNIATCIDHWETLKGTQEHGLGRERRLNDPRFLWEMQQVKEGKLPLVRTQEVDDSIELLYTMPDTLDPKEAVTWIREHMDEVVAKWL